MCSPHKGPFLLFGVRVQVSRIPRVETWVKIATLTFSVNGFVGAKNVDLKAVMVGPAFGVPDLAVALSLDIATQQ